MSRATQLVLRVALAVWAAVTAGPPAVLSQQVAPEQQSTLELVIDREQLVFEPEEQFDFRVKLALPDYVAGRVVDYRVTMRAVDGNRELWSQEEALDVPVDGQATVDVSVPLAAEEGVVSLEFTVLPPRAFQGFNPLRRAQPLAQREFQVLVNGPQAPAASTVPPEWREVELIEPNNPRWWQRLPAWTLVHRLPGLARGGPSGSVPRLIIRRESGQFIELPPQTAEGKSHWQAFALPVRDVGRPHQVEVEYPADGELQLGFSILEAEGPQSDAAPQVESGLFIDKHMTSPAGAVHRHRLVYWPTTKSPVLLVTNSHPTLPGYLGAIRVLAGPQQLAARSPANETSTTPRRILATTVSSATFSETFGVQGIFETDAQLTARDCQSAQLACRRLSEYMRYAGFNSAVLRLGAESPATGSADLPPEDLPEIDVLELLLETFHRQQAVLLPALEFDHRTLQFSDKLFKNYANHESLGGLVVRLNRAGLEHLAGSARQPGESVLQRFERDTGIRLSSSGTSSLDERRRVLVERHLSQWLSWRADLVTERMRTLAEQVRSRLPQGRLVVSLDPLLDDPHFRRHLRPALLENNELLPLLQESGIDVAALRQIDGVVLLEPQIVAPAAPLVDRAIDLQINSVSTAVVRTGADAPAGLLLKRRGRAGALAHLGADSALPTDQDELALLTLPVADANAARQALLRALGDSEREVIIEGGPAVAFGQEEAVRPQRRTWQWLPTGARMEQLPTDRADATTTQPVVVRRYMRPQDTTLCVINHSAWPVTTRLSLELPERCTVIESREANEQPGAVPAPRTLEAGPQSWLVDLKPYDMVAARFGAADVSVENVAPQIEPQVKESLMARIEDLGQRDKSSAEACEYDALANPGFESLGGESPSQPVSGWRTIANGTDNNVSYSETEPVGGRTCLLMESTTQPVGVESEPFATPPTGQLALLTYLKASGVTPESQLFIVFEAVDTPEYRQFTVIGGGSDYPFPADGTWGSYAFGVEDLPLDSDCEVVVKFELHGPGQVCIDELQMHNLLFPVAYQKDYSKQQRLALLKIIRAASNALERGHLADCEELLDGYWPRFMEAYLPRTGAEPTIVGPQVVSDPEPAAESPAEDDAPSVTDRLRGLFFWR